LAVGLGVVAAVASTAGLASADGLNFQISMDGYDLLPTAGNSASAYSSIGDIAIAYGDNANAYAVNGIGDFAEAIGVDAGHLPAKAAHQISILPLTFTTTRRGAARSPNSVTATSLLSMRPIATLSAVATLSIPAVRLVNPGTTTLAPLCSKTTRSTI
jgi:hypothetical protein